MIAPTVGRVVWFTPRAQHLSQMAVHGPQPMSAQICYVWHDRMVNLDVIDHRGQHHALGSVLLLQGDEEFEPVSSSCEWMPFQKGQAAKTDAAAPTKIGEVVNAAWTNSQLGGSAP